MARRGLWFQSPVEEPNAATQIISTSGNPFILLFQSPVEEPNVATIGHEDLELNSVV
jgi:hypothetical protein